MSETPVVYAPAPELRTIQFRGGNAFVGLVGTRGTQVRLVLNDWDDGVDAALDPDTAWQLAQALAEFSVAARQSAASLVAPSAER